MQYLVKLASMQIIEILRCIIEPLRLTLSLRKNEIINT